MILSREQLIQRRDQINAEIAALRREKEQIAQLLCEPRTGKQRGSYTDKHFVETKYLIQPLRKYLGAQEDNPRRVMDLAAHCDIAVSTIRRILRGSSEFTSFFIADNVLTHIGREDVLREVQVHHIPKWSHWTNKQRGDDTPSLSPKPRCKGSVSTFDSYASYL